MVSICIFTIANPNVPCRTRVDCLLTAMYIQGHETRFSPYIKRVESHLVLRHGQGYRINKYNSGVIAFALSLQI